MKGFTVLICAIFFAAGATAQVTGREFGENIVVDMGEYGIVPDTGENMSPLILKALDEIRAGTAGKGVTLRFAPGRYDFHEAGAAQREYYISNHDQDNPKAVAFPLEEWRGLTLDGQGADFMFHGTMIPIALIGSEDCALQDFSIDFETPHITQIRITENGEAGTAFETAPWTNCRINESGLFEAYGEGWANVPRSCIAFEEATRHIVYRSGDLGFPAGGVREVAPHTFIASEWKDERLVPGTVAALRTGSRPAPAIFLSGDRNTCVQNVKVHYADGMGLLAQLCENIALDGFGVCLRRDDDPRYFTAQADATHFSQCRGKIESCNGLYEGMMDDAINVHGIYLKINKVIDERTIIASYMHSQAYGFPWGTVGDEVQFIRPSTMEIAGTHNRVAEMQEDFPGTKDFIIRFEEPLDSLVEEGFGVENLTWCPEVHFAGNVIRNNRARGALFSTPRETIVEDNLFDHTSGSAILLCGDCNGWYESGACRNVQIRRNRFVNALTSLYQFTEAVISVYPVIPDPEGQVQYFHGGEGETGIVVECNEFDVFDIPILYAKSVDGIIFRNNVIRENSEYPPFHPNRNRFLLIHTANAVIEDTDPALQNPLKP